MKLILNITRYYKVYKNKEKRKKREHDSILYYFIGVLLHCNVDPTYRTHINK